MTTALRDLLVNCFCVMSFFNVNFDYFPGPFRGGARVPETAQEVTV